MGNMDRWDVVLFMAAAYLAVTLLVRLMTRHRNTMIHQLERQADHHRKRKQRESYDKAPAVEQSEDAA